MIHPVAVLYDDWGCPKYIRYIRFWNDLGKGLVTEYKKNHYDTDYTNVFLCDFMKHEVVDVPYDTVLVQQEQFTGYDSLPLGRDLAWRVGSPFLKGIKSITEVTSDMRLYSDTIQILGHWGFDQRSDTVVIADWKGRTAVVSYDLLRKRVLKCNLQLNDCPADFNWHEYQPLYHEEYMSSEVEAQIERETVGVTLFGQSRCAVRPYEGKRVLELKGCKNAIISPFWNIVRTDDTSVESIVASGAGTMCCFMPSVSALNTLKVQELCYGMIVDVPALSHLVLPKEMHELHPGGGVNFALACEKLGEEVTELDMTNYKDLVHVRLSLRDCSLKRLVLKVPRESQYSYVEAVEQSTLDGSKRKWDISLTNYSTVFAPLLEELVLIEEEPVINSAYVLNIFRAESLKTIDIYTSGKQNLSVEGIGNSIVKINIHAALKLMLSITEFNAVVMLNVDDLGKNWGDLHIDVSGRIDERYKVVCEDFDKHIAEVREIQRNNPDRVGVILLCCSDKRVMDAIKGEPM